MTKPIPDKAEVVLEYPEKLYAGILQRSALAAASSDCVCRRTVKGSTPTDETLQMTAEEAVLLLHIME
jgi:hypothetical protein